jgi:ribosomal protein S18 acetylase RimI-like enzyme
VAIDLALLTGPQVQARMEQIVSVYRESFRALPYGKQETEVLDFAASLPEHLCREGFRFVAATGGAPESIVGFAYGYQSLPGQFWHENAVKAMGDQLAHEWLTQSFQLVEIAVAPKFQGQGIGGRLHDHLLVDLPYRKAVLSTMRAQTVAHWLYRRRGWQVLVEDMRFPKVDRPYRLMGLDLALSEGQQDGAKPYRD